MFIVYGPYALYRFFINQPQYLSAVLFYYRLVQYIITRYSFFIFKIFSQFFPQGKITLLVFFIFPQPCLTVAIAVPVFVLGTGRGVHVQYAVDLVFFAKPDCLLKYL